MYYTIGLFKLSLKINNDRLNKENYNYIHEHDFHQNGHEMSAIDELHDCLHSPEYQ